MNTETYRNYIVEIEQQIAAIDEEIGGLTDRKTKLQRAATAMRELVTDSAGDREVPQTRPTEASKPVTTRPTAPAKDAQHRWLRASQITPAIQQTLEQKVLRHLSKVTGSIRPGEIYSALEIRAEVGRIVLGALEDKKAIVLTGQTNARRVMLTIAN